MEFPGGADLNRTAPSARNDRTVRARCRRKPGDYVWDERVTGSENASTAIDRLTRVHNSFETAGIQQGAKDSVSGYYRSGPPVAMIKKDASSRSIKHNALARSSEAAT